jgi:transcriptional regulator with XRE-family HTH domain/predicted nucleic acid-binding protein
METENHSETGARLRDRRISAGLSLETATQGICTPGYLSLIENGKRKATKHVLEKLEIRYSENAGSENTEFESDPHFAKAEFALRLRDFESFEIHLARLSANITRDYLLGKRKELDGSTEQLAILFIEVSRKALSRELKLKATLSAVKNLRDIGETNSAIELGLACVSDFEGVRNSHSLALNEVRFTLANALSEVGRFVEAQVLLDQATPDNVHSTREIVLNHWAQADIDLLKGDLVSSEGHMRDALNHLSLLEAPGTWSALKRNQIWVQVQLGVGDSRLQCDELSAITSFQLDNRDLEGALHSIGTKSLIHAKNGQKNLVQNALEHQEKLSEEFGLIFSPSILIERAQSLMTVGDSKAAHSNLSSAMQSLGSSKVSRSNAQVWRNMAAMFERLDDLPLAYACMKASTECAGIASPFDSFENSFSLSNSTQTTSNVPGNG